MKVLKKIFSITLTVLVVLCFVIIGEVAIESLIQGHLSFFGFMPIQILSGSMQASGINPGDTLLVRETANFQVGDIIAFYHDGNIWFHQIVSINNGVIQTMGTSNNTIDPFTITASDVIGVNTGASITVLGLLWVKIIIIVVVYLIVVSFIAVSIYKIFKKDNAERADQTAKSGIPSSVGSKDNKHALNITKLGVIALLASSMAFVPLVGAHAAPVEANAYSVQAEYTMIDCTAAIKALHEMIYSSGTSVVKTYYATRPAGSKGATLDSTGKNWAPKVEKELAAKLGDGITASQLADASWAITRIAENNYNIYFTYYKISSMNVGDTISQVYRFYDLNGANEYSYSTAPVKMKTDGTNYYKVIDVNNYDVANRTIFTA